MTVEHMEEMLTPLGPEDIPWLVVHRVSLIDPDVVDPDAEPPAILALVMGRLEYPTAGGWVGSPDAGDASIVGLACTIETAGQLIDALRTNAAEFGHGNALTSSMDQAEAARRLHGRGNPR